MKPKGFREITINFWIPHKKTLNKIQVNTKLLVYLHY